MNDTIKNASLGRVSMPEIDLLTLGLTDFDRCGGCSVLKNTFKQYSNIVRDELNDVWELVENQGVALASAQIDIDGLQGVVALQQHNITMQNLQIQNLVQVTTSLQSSVNDMKRHVTVSRHVAIRKLLTDYRTRAESTILPSETSAFVRSGMHATIDTANGLVHDKVSYDAIAEAILAKEDTVCKGHYKVLFYALYGAGAYEQAFGIPFTPPLCTQIPESTSVTNEPIAAEVNLIQFD